MQDNNSLNRSRGPGGLALRSTDDRWRDYIVRSTQIYIDGRVSVNVVVILLGVRSNLRDKYEAFLLELTWN
jgi:hypothetical protein